jgi:predicted O-methyltransferase YrrM
MELHNAAPYTEAELRRFQQDEYNKPHKFMMIPMGYKYGPTFEYEIAALGFLVHHAEEAMPEGSVIVEIGSLLGKSAIAMASVTDQPIICIDPHNTEAWIYPRGMNDPEEMRDWRAQMGDTYEQFIENLEYFDVRHKIEVIKQYSDQAAREWDGRKIGMLFIDGDHSYKWCKHDFEAFEKHLVPGAIVVFHDFDAINFPGVFRYVSELIQFRKIKIQMIVGTMASFNVLNA